VVHEWRYGPWLGAPVWVAPLDKAVKDVPGLFGLAPHTRYTRARCGPPFRFRSTPPARRGEKGVRLAQKMHAGPCIPVRTQR
jgi:hypothetical protein